MNLQSIAIRRINPAPYNPRIDLQPSDPAYEQLRKSIDEFGCVQPLVWNKRSGNLIGGHQRLKILIEQGAREVEVSVVNLTPEREKLLNIALNKIQGDWDQEKLARLLDELTKTPEVEVELSGFDLPDIQELIASVLNNADEGHDEDFDIEAELARQGPVITQLGDLLELGDHRLLCGDSTNPKDVQRLMQGQKAILFATDPPYLVNYDGKNHPGSKRKNKDWSGSYGITWDDAAANPDLYEKFYAVATAHAIAPNAAWYCWHASRRQAMVEAVWTKFGAFVHQQILWVKDRPVLTRSWYGWQHEPCFFGWVRPNKPPRVIKEPLSTVWRVPTITPGTSPDHPTSKPLELFAIPMHQHTKRGELCYEPFCGSGSQLIAAQKLGRRCYALEISPRYCDVIVRRWLAYMGSRAPKRLIERYRRRESKVMA